MIKTKKEIRREVKQMVLAMPAAEREAQSQQVCEQIERLIAEHNPATVALFSPLPDEVNVALLIGSLACRVVLPRVGDKADGTPEMEFSTTLRRLWRRVRMVSLSRSRASLAVRRILT